VKHLIFSALIAGAITTLSFVSPASAQATRTWVSGVGDDANPCMLQNIDLAQGQNIDELRRFGYVTVTTAHDAYSNKVTRETLGVPLHKLSVFMGPELFKRSLYPDKKPILVVSHDAHPLKEDVLGLIARAHPQLEIRIVQNMSYEEYKALILEAKWSLTFGEGLDGYFVEPIFSGGNFFAVFNDRFFTPAFAELETVYPS
jgi:hypothetical protein